jgi:poly-gamma-glutamate capsule biosynthesis protein CapA/YwtB (metallophosphatase superfamily)
MLRLIFSALAVGATPLLAGCQTTIEAPAEGWLLGRVVDISGTPLSATLTIGARTYKTDQQGRFVISPPEGLVQRIEVAADGYYPMRHTFSRAELADNPKLDDVVLVARRPGRTLFVFGGDAMIGRRFYEPFEGEPVLVSPGSVLEDSKALLQEMKPYLSRADYASINLETPIFEMPPSEPAPKFVTFYSAPKTLEALEWAGVDYVALGNNHVYDFLEPGLDVTLKHLRKSALDFSGAGKTETEALKPFRLERGTDRFDFLSYVGWPAGPPSQTAKANKGGAALGTTEALLATTETSIGANGIPVLQFHGGLEYVEEPTLAMETKLKRAVDRGAALVIAHHPHVVQGLELYQDKLIAWSLGNFLFDQYFYSAQSAALLYVWMDGDEFHHAEAVPIYIKGYHPTPAVGPMRNAINRRLFDLSAKRNTHLKRSGGHMILSANRREQGETPKFKLAIDCQDEAARTGHDLLARGDFDAHELFDAPDRSWLDLDERIKINAESGASSDYAMHINLGARETVTTGMRKFQRVFTPGNPMTVRADVQSSSDAEIKVFLQIRATGQGLQDALDNGQRILLGSANLSAGEPVQVDLDFDSPRTRARSIRILLEVSAQETQGDITLDELEMIEWKTPFEADADQCPSASSLR